jgi:hypothetical protein
MAGPAYLPSAVSSSGWSLNACDRAASPSREIRPAAIFAPAAAAPAAAPAAAILRAVGSLAVPRTALAAVRALVFAIERILSG